jgi:hypothetical protein
MQKTEHTKLLIKVNSKDNIEERIKYYSQLLGIEKNRLILITKVSNEEYIDLFYNIDIMLDTFPYSGTTTTCNSLYNSIPVITLYNKDLHSHNVSSSLLINSGLNELVAYSMEEYIEKTVLLCNDKERINDYKKNIHGKFENLMNEKEFMKDYEKLLLELIK